MDVEPIDNQIKMEFWMKAWLVTAGATNTSRLGAPSEYADKALKDFEERFEKNRKDDFNITSANDL